MWFFASVWLLDFGIAKTQTLTEVFRKALHYYSACFELRKTPTTADVVQKRTSEQTLLKPMKDRASFRKKGEKMHEKGRDDEYTY